MDKTTETETPQAKGVHFIKFSVYSFIFFVSYLLLNASMVIKLESAG